MQKLSQLSVLGLDLLDSLLESSKMSSPSSTECSLDLPRSRRREGVVAFPSSLLRPRGLREREGKRKGKGVKFKKSAYGKEMVVGIQCEE